MHFYRKCWFDLLKEQFISLWTLAKLFCATQMNWFSVRLPVTNAWNCHSLYTAFSSNVGAWNMWACSIFLSWNHCSISHSMTSLSIFSLSKKYYEYDLDRYQKDGYLCCLYMINIVPVSWRSRMTSLISSRYEAFFGTAMPYPVIAYFSPTVFNSQLSSFPAWYSRGVAS